MKHDICKRLYQLENYYDFKNYHDFVLKYFLDIDKFSAVIDYYNNESKINLEIKTSFKNNNMNGLFFCKSNINNEFLNYIIGYYKNEIIVSEIKCFTNSIEIIEYKNSLACERYELKYGLETMNYVSYLININNYIDFQSIKIKLITECPTYINIL